MSARHDRATLVLMLVVSLAWGGRSSRPPLHFATGSGLGYLLGRHGSMRVAGSLGSIKRFHCIDESGLIDHCEYI
jgi:hypothetical protein